MQTVFVCFHCGRKVMSRVVRFLTRGPYSHVSILLPDGAHIEALQWKGVLWHPVFTADADEQIDFFPISLTDQQVDTIRRLARPEIGCGYDWWAILAFLTRQRWKAPSPTRWFCAELIAYLLEGCGLRLLRDTRPWELSPVELGHSPILPDKPWTREQVAGLLGAAFV